MAGLLPSRSDTTASDDATPRVIGVDSDGADELLAALSSETARKLLVALHDEPAAASAVADRIDTSLQNTQYHLDNLEDADLITEVDSYYSEKGREMSVYAPADQPLVVVAGKEEQTTGLKAAVKRLLGAIGVLGLASLVVEQAFGYGVVSAPVGEDAEPSAAEPTAADETADEGGPDAFNVDDGPPSEDAPTPGETPAPEIVSEPESAWTAIETADSMVGLPPGLLFFVGGLAVLLCGFAVRYYHD